jgi:hypothetical protein
MNTQDQLLHDCLEDLKKGVPLEQLIARIPPEHASLIPQLRLAAQTRTLPQAVLSPSRGQFQREMIKREARKVYRPSWLPASTPWYAVPAGAMAVLAVLLIILSAIFTTPASASYATLMDVNGIVEVSDDIAAEEWTPLENGDRVKEGQYVRTRFGSSATLVFYEGTRTSLASETQVGLQVVKGGFGRALTVELAQLSGSTHHSVVPLRGQDSAYIVHTASGQASVHGTAFDVDSAAGMTRFSVTHGKVEVTNADSVVLLTAGQASLVLAEEIPSDPTYEFSVQGPITAINGDQWTVGGLTFTVNPLLLNGRTWAVGDWVWVRGRVLPDGTLVADKVNDPNNDKERSNFTGVVESIGAEAWVVSGKTVLIDAKTEIDEGLEVGDPVEVSFVVQPDGSWLAKEIESLEDDTEPTPTPTVDITATVTTTPTVDLTASPTPDLTASPTPDLTTTPEVTATPEGNRAGCEATDKQHPTGLTLSARYGVPYEEIMGWFCQGYGFGEIDLAYELSVQSGIPVEEIFALRASGMGWGNIKKEIEKRSEITATPDGQPTVEGTPSPEDNGNGNGNDRDKPTKTPRVKPTKKIKP